MGIVVEFKDRIGRGRRRSQSARESEAEVVIFPGVRVRYWDEFEASDDNPTAPNSASRKSGKQRRR